jgi:pyridoxine 5-phosphate synthase
MRMVTEVLPDQVTLVPDTHNQLTSDHGWDTWKHLLFLKDVVERLRDMESVHPFLLTPMKVIEGAAETGAHRIELYTEPYARLYSLGT